MCWTARVHSDPDPYALLELACTLVGQASDLVREGRERALAESVGTKSTPTDVVTAMDTAAERLVVDGLRLARPGDAVLGEEGGERAAGPGDDQHVRWLLDPIDGTVNYLYGIPQYAVSLAAEVAGTVVAGVVRNPASGEEWTGVRGGGGWRGRPGTGTRLSGPATEIGRAHV